jgi:hypothetical protein
MLSQTARHMPLHSQLHSLSSSHQLSVCHCPHVRTLFYTTQRQRHCILGSAAAQQQQQQQQVLAVPYPPQGYDYKSEILDETIDVVSQQYPQLMGLVEQGEGLKLSL